MLLVTSQDKSIMILDDATPDSAEGVGSLLLQALTSTDETYMSVNYS